MAIKDSAETWVRSKPVQAMSLVAAIGVVVGGVIGLGAGYKIEQSRTRSDVKRLQQQIKQAGIVNPSGPIGQRVGTVKGTSAGSITLQTKLQGTQTIQTGSTTPFEKTAGATKADIAVGHRVLVSKGGRDVVILPTASKLGRLVTNVGTDSFSVANKEGRPVKVKLANVQHVYTLTTAKIADVKVGADVLVGGRTSGASGFAAVEVIILPQGSGFNG